MKEYDLLVIGAGAGTKLVTPPSLLGKKVAVFEKESPGGTCLNRGCIPSKMLIYPSELIRQTQEYSKFPINLPGVPNPRFGEIVTRISQTVDQDYQGIPLAYAKNPNIDYYPQAAKFLSSHVLEAAGETFTAPIVVVAVGSRPSIPPIPGLIETPYWTSREALRNTQLPKSLIVLGGGYIGLELGSAYQGYGSKVSLYTRSEILRYEDSEIKAEFRKHSPFPLFEFSTAVSVSYNGKEFHCQFETPSGKTEARAEALLVATGLVPNTDNLGLENTKIKTNPAGYIQVDETLETEEKSVFSFGDCIGRYFFRHSANYEGEKLFESLFQSPVRKKISYPPMPSAVFTTPQIASVGLTEDECLQRGIRFWKGVNPYSSSAMGMARMSTSGFVKLLFDPSSEKCLGAHIIGEEASNLIQMFVLGMTQGLKLDAYLDMIYIHPALPEVSRNALRKIREQRGKH